ncbi:ABC transporter permease [Odoribacter sp. OttesenSCG-928-J03]|nr:ABC transporter permease [Odoribacter sp. OttesenSCG-928-J03]
MNKTLIIIGREFSTRVRKKSFLLITIFVPILFVLFYAFLMWMMLKSDTQERQIAVVNNSTLNQPLEKINNTVFTYSHHNITEENANQFLRNNSAYYAVLWIPENVMENADIPVYSFSQVPMDLKHDIASELRNHIEGIKKSHIIEELDIPELEEKLDATKTRVNVRTLVVSDSGETKEGSAEITSIIGIAGGFIIYFFIFMYATQVMRGVIEEKSNRIIEVLVSSVKPFQFLLGKILGIASVGLLQFIIWVVLGAIAIIGLQFAFMPQIDMDTLRNASDLTMMAQTNNLDIDQLKIIQNISKTINPTFILGFLSAFVFYFIGGYLLYASMFAAIGSAVDNETDSQQFMTPLSIILIAAIYIGFAAMKSPESPLAVWSSIIPFTSPIVMLVRLPFGIPAWQIIASMVSLVACFILFTWLSARIYRVGILMYGKKVTWKELFKWLKY